jgi:hypothetical protein
LSAATRWTTIVPILVLLSCAAPCPARGQVFIASRPDPDFRIGPLFVSASVKPADVEAGRAPLTVTVSWSLVLPPHGNAAAVAQDL